MKYCILKFDMTKELYESIEKLDTSKSKSICPVLNIMQLAIYSLQLHN